MVARKHEVRLERLTNISLKQLKRTLGWKNGFPFYTISIILYCIVYVCAHDLHICVSLM